MVDWTGLSCVEIITQPIGPQVDIFSSIINTVFDSTSGHFQSKHVIFGVLYVCGT